MRGLSVVYMLEFLNELKSTTDYLLNIVVEQHHFVIDTIFNIRGYKSSLH